MLALSGDFYRGKRPITRMVTWEKGCGEVMSSLIFPSLIVPAGASPSREGPVFSGHAVLPGETLINDQVIWFYYNSRIHCMSLPYLPAGFIYMEPKIEYIYHLFYQTLQISVTNMYAIENIACI